MNKKIALITKLSSIEERFDINSIDDYKNFFLLIWTLFENEEEDKDIINSVHRLSAHIGLKIREEGKPDYSIEKINSLLFSDTIK